MLLYLIEPEKVPISSQKHKYAQTSYLQAGFFLVVLCLDQTKAV